MCQEMTGFFVAGMKTIQISTMNTIYYTTRHSEYGAKLLQEVYPVIDKAS